MFSFIVSLIFVGMGIWMWIESPDKHTPSAITAFFTLCLMISAVSLIEKARIQRYMKMTGEVTVMGGVPIPASKTRMGGICFSLLIAGLIMVWGSRDLGRLYLIGSMVIAGAGLVGLIGMGTGWFCDHYLLFEPAGIRFGRRNWSFLVRWDQIIRFSGGELANNPAVFLSVTDPAHLLKEIQVTNKKNREAAQRKLAKLIRSNQSWFGFDLVILPAVFGINLALLLKTFETYCSNQARREELGRRAISS